MLLFGIFIVSYFYVFEYVLLFGIFIVTAIFMVLFRAMSVEGKW